MILCAFTLLLDNMINRKWLNQINGFPNESKQDIVIIELTAEDKKVNKARKIEELR